jgi:hypothetical protein
MEKSIMLQEISAPPTLEKAQFLNNALILDESLSRPEWDNIGTFLKTANKAVQWWIGDWLNFGERKWGEMYTQALEQTDYEQGSLRQMKWVSSKVQLCTRVHNLDWTHYREVADLPQPQQELWLTYAEKNNTSVHDLRRLIKGGIKELTQETPALESSEWYKSLVDDCKAIITEAVFASNWALVEGYHELGKRLRQDGCREPITKLLQRVAVDIGSSERTLWYAVQFYDKFPDLELLPLGKDASWRKVIALLPEAKEEKEDKDETYDNIIDCIDLMKEYAKATLEIANNIEYRKTIVSPAQATLVFDQTNLMYGLWDNLKHQLITKTGMKRG